MARKAARCQMYLIKNGAERKRFVNVLQHEYCRHTTLRIVKHVRANCDVIG